MRNWYLIKYQVVVVVVINMLNFLAHRSKKSAGDLFFVEHIFSQLLSTGSSLSSAIIHEVGFS